VSPRSALRPALSPREFRSTYATVRTALAASDEITLGHFQRVRFSHKADGSEVTVADKGGERMLRRHLAAAWPRDPVLGEEYGGTLARSGRCWLIDPIDGTASYVLGVPMFGTLISLLLDGEPVFGCIHLSALKETTYGARGLGCWRQRRSGSRASRKVTSRAARARGGSRTWHARPAACAWSGTACSTRSCAGAPWTRRSTR
jgi:fructose-1,6-bisphosphatase/inositol monophosphatase family enzyme